VSVSFYCDTSALVKLYRQEVGTERMEELFRQEENVLVISDRFWSIGMTSLERLIRYTGRGTVSRARLAEDANGDLV